MVKGKTVPSNRGCFNSSLTPLVIHFPWLHVKTLGNLLPWYCIDRLGINTHLCMHKHVNTHSNTFSNTSDISLSLSLSLSLSDYTSSRTHIFYIAPFFFLLSITGPSIHTLPISINSFAGKEIELAGDCLTGDQMAATVSKVRGGEPWYDDTMTR